MNIRDELSWNVGRGDVYSKPARDGYKVVVVPKDQLDKYVRSGYSIEKGQNTNGELLRLELPLEVAEEREKAWHAYNRKRENNRTKQDGMELTTTALRPITIGPDTTVKDLSPDTSGDASEESE